MNGCRNALCKTPVFDKQVKIISAVFCLIAALLVIRLFTTAILTTKKRARLLDELSIATTLKIPGCRGKIIDHDGHTLAWTERQLQLIWHVPENYSHAEFEWTELIRFNTFTPAMPHITRLTDYLGQDVILCSNQPFSSPDIWAALRTAGEHLECRSSFRRCLSNPNLKDKIGETAVNPETSLEEGISGYELEYDNLLRAGFFEVKLLNTPYRAILNESKGNGQDIKLNATYDF